MKETEVKLSKEEDDHNAQSTVDPNITNRIENTSTKQQSMVKEELHLSRSDCII